MWWVVSCGLVSPGFAADVSVTSIGAQAFRAEAIDAQSADLLLGERLRWSLAEQAQLRVDGRFLVPVMGSTGAPLEESRVREVGVAVEAPAVSLWLGRHPLMQGGRRLVDGVQAAAHPGGADRGWSLGAWAGLVPDEFTTAPTTRFGGGPIVGLDRGVASAHAVGDIVLGSGGIQRAAAIATGRVESGSTFQAQSRLDWVFADGAGGGGLSDGAVYLSGRPARPVRLDAFYNAYSTLLYQSRASSDPQVRRFAARVEQLGITGGIDAELLDPTLHHLIGGAARVTGTAAVHPVAQLGARTQLHADRAETFTRLSAGTGLAGLAGDRVELGVDGNLLWLDGAMGGDAGVTVLLEPVPDAAIAVDTSVRLLLDPIDFRGVPGAYVDLFVDVVSRGGTSVSAGGSWTSEPSDIVGTDVGLAAYVRLQQWIRPTASRRAGSDRPTVPSPTIDSTPPGSAPAPM